MISRLVLRLFGSKKAVANAAPTGAAATLLYNGSTTHRIACPPRPVKRDDKSASVCDKPLSDERLRVLRETMKGLRHGSFDERGMHTKELLAFLDKRLREIFKTDEYFGGLASVLFSGDPGQLPGVGGTGDLHEKPGSGDNAIIQAGYAAYRAFLDVIVLDETMRQSPEEKELLDRLLNVRCGEVVHDDWVAINNRHIDVVFRGDKAGKDAFLAEAVKTLHETWAPAHAANLAELVKLGEPVATLPARNSGTCAKNPAKDCGQISGVALVASGMRFMLLKNQVL